ncbi:MAG: NitT/TauT family transport system ATP-binding protein [Eubacteriaceae bacterium]|jgi:NitT/TauT family transport system ATP-binding protein|nr:NitT/TauT family transport system ATP-binding protein [Eubacteriaceae bacterium]MDN5307135.1 NitT/TauT family transport system ATP-binding protein [Eubacteriaceae bacterium]
MIIEIKNLCKTYDQQMIFDDFSLTIERDIITGITGPSGAGKTTLLRLLAGLEKPDSGSIEGLQGGSLSYVFQEPRLLPWCTVRENLRFVCPQGHDLKKDFESEIDIMLDQVGLTEAQSLYPQALSGGMKQRVSIARSFLVPSELLLMDEPFISLDLDLKERLMELFLSLWEKKKRTVLFVSHDPLEMKKLSHTILTLSDKPVRILKREENKKL